ncbi:triphosphoribosyl-dephospho-CoA synthase [Singulisphaera sp. Ch08]|uniref:triphosphoribosyl-dephospho-CoA synthase n=1 Tax=Singulisphaera sp. Ch08 TaxID=3120278 RepID=A0AAU7C8D2_9BACT
MMDPTLDAGSLPSWPLAPDVSVGLNGRAMIGRRSLHLDFLALELSHLAVAVLLEEAELTPKPALVDRRGNGAHHDLDLAKLCRSAHALQDGFAAIARVAADEKPSLRLREQIGRIGREMEQRMLAATDGSNAHRGAIWALGLLVAAAAQRRSDRRPASLGEAAAVLARLPDTGLATDRPADRPLSPGERAHLRYGVAGARGEAQAAFPHAIRVALPVLRAARARGASEDCARLDALMAIMASLDDTCLLHRGGRAALEAAKAGARAVLRAGGAGECAGRQHLDRLHADLMARWASPGGSADLLAVTLFLDRFGDGSHPATSQTGELRWRR